MEWSIVVKDFDKNDFCKIPWDRSVKYSMNLFIAYL